ncbi:hypothetical protein ACO0K2_12700 [Undibacterium sp. MH2W]
MTIEVAPSDRSMTRRQIFFHIEINSWNYDVLTSIHHKEHEKRLLFSSKKPQGGAFLK